MRERVWYSTKAPILFHHEHINKLQEASSAWPLREISMAGSLNVRVGNEDIGEYCLVSHTWEWHEIDNYIERKNVKEDTCRCTKAGTVQGRANIARV
jgi:hypothetical protein